MKKQLNEINTYIEEHKVDILSVWKELVELESGSDEPESVRIIANRIKDLFEAEGLSCELIDTLPNGPTLVGIIGEERPSKPIVFSGHMDTVYPSGSWKDELFVIKDGNVHGPGVLDMKGGLVIALFVIKALNYIAYNEAPLKIVFSGDEEHGHHNSEGAKIFTEHAKGGLFAFNLETGRIDNSLCTGRKGKIDAKIVVTGKSSHAGNDFEAGCNAIEEMAHKIIEIQKLTNLKAGTSVSVGIISGGTVSNSIPSSCEIELDIRYTNQTESARVKAELDKIANEVVVEGTSTEAIIHDGFAAYETTQEVEDMYDFVCNTARKYGFDVPGRVFLGGCSDAAYVTIAKTPVICSFGVLGEWNHTLREYAVIDSIYERINFISTIILNKDEF